MNKGIAAVLSCAMLFVSVGCTSTSPVSSAASTQSDSSSVVSAASSQQVQLQVPDNMNATGLPIMKNKHVFKIAVGKSVLSKNTFPEKECVIQTEAATNIAIEWMEIPDSGWKEKTNIMLASMDLPDAFMGKVDVVANLNALAPLDAHIAQYGPAIQQLFTERPDIAKALVAPDGKIHSLPVGDETYNNKISSNMYINKVWLGKLGLAVPTTTDEFTEVLRAFKSKDPNGNGQNDEVPLTFRPNWLDIGNLLGSFGTLGNSFHVMTVEGKTVFTPALPEYYEGLQWLHQLFSEKLIDAEVFTQNEEQLNSKFKGKNILGTVASFDPSIVAGGDKLADYVAVLPLKGPQGKQMWNDTGSIGIQGFTITTSCKTPEALVRWYDYIRSDAEVGLLWSRGPKGVSWDWTEDGKKWKVIEKERPSDMPYGQWRHTIASASSGPFFSPASLAGPDGQEFTSARDILKVATVASYLPYAYESLPTGLPSIENANERSMLLADIDNYMLKFVSNAVINGIDDKGWNAHLKTCESLKTSRYQELCQQYVDSIQ